MPETLPAVRRCLGLLAGFDIARAALLVVPGVDWPRDDLEELRAFASEGHELVAHGWLHRTTPSRPYHRAHALLLSRGVAEHLALDRRGVIDLTRRSRRWFDDKGLPVPESYVPPAWALGPLRGEALAEQPFSIIETLRGVYLRGDDGCCRLVPLPLLGFEADSALREGFLARWNRSQLRHARHCGRPLRIAVHPHDPELRLGYQLRAVLGLGWTPITYASLRSQHAGAALCA